MSVPKLAATIIVCRPSLSGNKSNFQILMVKRSSTARFMPNHHVFPGGVFEETDAHENWKQMGLISNEVQYPFSNDLVVGKIAALRELFEETGLLITDPMVHTGSDEIEKFRTSVQESPINYMNILNDKSLKLPLHKVIPFQRWITPPQEKWRYDTYFYITLLDTGAVVTADSKETTRVDWFSPEEALDAYEKASVRLAPPTILVLSDLSSYSSLNSLRNACSQGFNYAEPISPNLSIQPGNTKEEMEVTLIIQGKPKLKFLRKKDGSVSQLTRIMESPSKL